QRYQHRAALVLAVGAAEPAAAHPLQGHHDLIEIAAHLLDLGVDRAALRRAVVEQREEPGAVAAHAPPLSDHAVEFGLLPRGGFWVAADLLVPDRIAAAAAAVNGRKLTLEPDANRVGRAALLRRRVLRHLRERILRRLRQGISGWQGSAEQECARQNPTG